jgi:S1-C subfamily serine protease
VQRDRRDFAAPVRPANRTQRALILALVAGGILLLAASGVVIASLLRNAGRAPAPVPLAADARPPVLEAPPRKPELPPAKAPLPDEPVARAAPAPEVPPADPSPEAIPLPILRDIKDATVFIKVETGTGTASGSGFVIRGDGDTGLVVTNHHVITPPPPQAVVRTPLGVRRVPLPRQVIRPANPTITAVFRSGTADEQSARAEILADDGDRDLAVLRVRGLRNFPKPIDIGRVSEPYETMPVYIFGFPFGKALALNNGNPAITVGRGSVSSLRRNDRGAVAAVQIDGALNPGNSGGPLVDSRGRLVGVAVKTIMGSGIGVAIAPGELSQLLHGRLASALVVRVKRADGDSAVVQGELWVFDNSLNVESSGRFSRSVPVSALPEPPAGGAIEMEVGAHLHDPLNKIRSLAVHYRPAGTLPDPLRAQGGRWPPLWGARKADLKVDGQKATVMLAFTLSDKTDDRFYFQVSFTDADGQTRSTQPVLFHVNQPVAALVARPGSGASPRGTPREEPKPLEGDELARVVKDLHSPDVLQRRRAVKRLAAAQPTGQREAVARALEPLVTDSDTFTRQGSIQALAVWGDRESLPTLVKALDSDNAFTRRAAIEALGRLKDERAAEPLARCLADAANRSIAGQALQALGAPAEQAVLPLLKHASWEVRLEACRVLKMIGTDAALPALRETVHDANGIVRRAAEEAVGSVGRRS